MDLEKLGRHALLSWVAFGLLVALVLVLAGLQYRWIGEVSVAEHERLRESLNASLDGIRRDFNSEISQAISALAPSDADVESQGRQGAYEARYADWRTFSSRTQMFKGIAVAGGDKSGIFFYSMDLNRGALAPAEWPADWQPLRGFVESRVTGDPMGPPRLEGTTLIDVPRFREARGPGPGKGGPPARGGEQDWLLLELDAKYAAQVLLPELFTRHLGASYEDQYLFEVVSAWNASEVIVRNPGTESLTETADAWVALFDAGQQPIRGPQGKGPGMKGPGFEGPGDRNRGRWRLMFRARTGSLEAVVANTRIRNLAVSGGILLLLIATAGALVKFSRQAQRLAQVEMEFVAGVSHELRTPLTVIRTAAFNLKGKLAGNPSQVERYGALIQRESEKLTAIVEQVLRFASAKSGQVIREREPVSVETLIEGALHSSKSVLEDTLSRVETSVDPGLPPIAGDAMALQHALQNLINNAVKYGMTTDRWVGLSARGVLSNGSRQVEIRVEDRGPGIPTEEQPRVFDAFFRGAKAVRDQVHGTGLGLNLVKRIVEAHGGTVHVESREGPGACFVLRFPTLPTDTGNELQHSLG